MKTNVPSHNEHKQVILEIIEDYSLEHLMRSMDHIGPDRLWTCEFMVGMESMVKGKEGYGIPRFTELSVMTFTDGSKTEECTWVGIALTKHDKFMRDFQIETEECEFSISIRDVWQQNIGPDDE